MLSCCFVKKKGFGQKTASDIFTDKRFFTDKPTWRLQGFI